MRTVIFTIPENSPRFAGQTVEIRQPENTQDAFSLFGGEAQAVDKLGDVYANAAKGLVKRAAAVTEGEDMLSLDEIQKGLNAYVVKQRGDGSGSVRELKPETKAKRAAQGSGNRLFERARADEKFLRQMVRQGIIEEEEYNAWLAVNPAPEGELVTA